MAKKKDTAANEPVDVRKLEDLLSQCDVKTVDILSITPNRWNKNKMGSQYYAALKNQLLDPNIGFTTPIMVRANPYKDENQFEYEIIDGEHRFRAAKEIGMTKVPIQFYGEISDAKAKFLMIAQNKIHGATSDADIKDVLQEIEEELSEGNAEWKELNVWLRTVTEEPVADSSDYGLDDEDLDTQKNPLIPIQMYMNDEQAIEWRKATGKLRLTHGVSLEEAAIMIIDFYNNNFEVAQ